MKNVIMTAMTALVATSVLAAEVKYDATKPIIKINFDQIVGKVKPEHGVGQPPMRGVPPRYDNMYLLKHAGVPFSRLHDVGGWFGGNMYVDIPNLFRNFDADETKPENYDFDFTDALLVALEKNGVEPYFRLGVTIENFSHFKKYRIFPPKDYAKWARICEHVIRHYTEGWANGYKMNIRYWEIWNEPDSMPDPQDSYMWCAPFSEYCKFYGVVSKHLKAKFPHLKIGGYASCGFYAITDKVDDPRFPNFVKCFDEFLDYIKANQCPLDFFSWHGYTSVSNAMVHMRYVREKLDKAGYPNAESSLNEWLTPAKTGSLEQALEIAAMMIACQNGPVDNTMLYDARDKGGRYGPLFNPEDGTLYPAYWSLKAFNELYVRKHAVKVDCKEVNVYVAAAELNGDGAVLVVNDDDRLDIPLAAIDFGTRKVVGCRAINKRFNFQDSPLPEVIYHKTLYLFNTTVKK